MAGKPCGRSTRRPGAIDFLWKGADGWHLLVLEAGEGRQAAVRALEAWVVGEQMGEAPRSATTLDLRTGCATAVDTGAGVHTAAWMELAEQLSPLPVRRLIGPLHPPRPALS